MSERIQSVALYQEVAERLRKRIYQRLLKPDEVIDEKLICAELGISRTPLREALKVLHADGLVTLEPRRGCRVSSLSEQQLNELFPVMAVLEGLCAREAVINCRDADLAELDEQHQLLEQHAADGDIDSYYDVNIVIHDKLRKLSNNRYLEKVSNDLQRILMLARHEQLKESGRLEASLNEHRGLMEALHKHDPELAEARMKEHLLHQGAALNSQKKKYRTPSLSQEETEKKQHSSAQGTSRPVKETD